MYELQVKCKCLSCGSTLGSENTEEVYFSCELCKDVSKEVGYKEMLDLRNVKAWCSIKAVILFQRLRVSFEFKNKFLCFQF